MRDTEVCERLTRIERTVGDIETALRRLALQVQREESIHTGALAEVKRCVADIRSGLGLTETVPPPRRPVSAWDEVRP